MSVAVLKNTNTSSIILWKDGEVLIARGLLPSAILNEDNALYQISKVLPYTTIIHPLSPYVLLSHCHGERV